MGQLPPEVIAADRALEGRASSVVAGVIAAAVAEESAATMSVRNAARLLGVSPTTVMRRRQRAQGYAPDEDGTIVVRRTRLGTEKTVASRSSGAGETDDTVPPAVAPSSV